MSSEYEKVHQVIDENHELAMFETPAQTPVREGDADVDDGSQTLKRDAGGGDSTAIDVSSILDQSVDTLPSDATAPPTTTAVTIEKQKTPPGLTLEELERMDPEVKALYLTAQPARTETTGGQSIGKGMFWCIESHLNAGFCLDRQCLCVSLPVCLSLLVYV